MLGPIHTGTRSGYLVRMSRDSSYLCSASGFQRKKESFQTERIHTKNQEIEGLEENPIKNWKQTENELLLERHALPHIHFRVSLTLCFPEQQKDEEENVNR